MSIGEKVNADIIPAMKAKGWSTSSTIAAHGEVVR